MIDAAKQNGVTVMGMRKYLDTIGYRVPTGPGISVTPGYRFVPPPLQGDAPKKDDKPPMEGK